MLAAFPTKYGPLIGGAIGVAGGVWMLRELHSDSLVVRIAAFVAAFAAGLIGGYLMKYLDGTDSSTAKPDAVSSPPPRGDDERRN